MSLFNSNAPLYYLTSAYRLSPRTIRYPIINVGHHTKSLINDETRTPATNESHHHLFFLKTIQAETTKKKTVQRMAIKLLCPGTLLCHSFTAICTHTLAFHRGVPYDYFWHRRQHPVPVELIHNTNSFKIQQNINCILTGDARFCCNIARRQSMHFFQHIQYII